MDSGLSPSASSSVSPIFTARDDDFHDIGDRWWATETSWFSFHHRERRLGGWLYMLARPNAGVVQGGAWVWDDTAWAPWEVLYYANHSSKRFPHGQSLKEILLPTGVSIEVVEPLTSYLLEYRDPGIFEAELRFDAVMEPAPYAAGKPPFLAASHFDQLGRVTGIIRLRGEELRIDCLSLRDRSWGPRPEHRMRRLSYCFGAASASHAFFCTTTPATASDSIDHGFLIRDSRIAMIRSGQRSVERDADTGWIVSEAIEGTDEGGREFRAEGRPVSHMAVNRHTAVTWNYLTRWDLDGEEAWGEDQDMWPVEEWSTFRRRA